MHNMYNSFYIYISATTAAMDDMEDGELPDSPSGPDTEEIPLNGDAIDAPYTPLLRPESVKSITNIVTRPRSATNSRLLLNTLSYGKISSFFP